MKSRTQAPDQEAWSRRPPPDTDPSRTSTEARSAWRGFVRLPWPVLAAAVVAGAIAAAIARLVFPLLSINNDEAVYLLQADALAHGSLFPRAPAPLSAFTPWFMAVRDGHYLPKYTPFFPAFLALSKVLTGGTVAALVLMAAAVPVVTYLLAKEATGERRAAVVASILVAGSPLVLVHSGLHLTYLPTMVLLEAFAWMLLRGVRTGAGGWLAGAGLALSSVATTRPYDSVLFGLPLLAWALLLRPVEGGMAGRLRPLAWIVAGGALPAALLAAYNVMATGNPLRLPFSLTEPLDKLGFGVRKMFPTDTRHRFGPYQGAKGVVLHLRQLTAWSAGGVLTIALAAIGLWRRRSHGPLLAVAAVWVTFPLGYLFFWGPWNLSVLWGGASWFGPFYFMPLLPSLAILAALALTRLWTTRRPAVVALAGLMAASSVVMTVVVTRAHLRFSADEQRLVALLDAAQGRQIVFVALTPSLMHPSSVLSNNWEASGQRVFAVYNPATNLQAAERLGDRMLLQLAIRSRRKPNPDLPAGATLRRLSLVKGPTLPISMHARLPSPPQRLLLKVSIAGRTTTFDLGPQSKAELTVAGLRLHGDGQITLDGRQPLDVHLEKRDKKTEKTMRRTVVLQLFDPGSAVPTRVATEEMVASFNGDHVQALVPGPALATFGTGKPPRLVLSND